MARRNKGGIGSDVSIPDENRVTHKAEIEARDTQATQMPPTGFTQIGTADEPSLNRASKAARETRSPLKFSHYKG